MTTQKPLSIIVAIDESNAIGLKNNLLAYIPADLKRFKAITTGHTVVMGSNTWMSLPKRPLPERTNIVITSRSGNEFEGATLAHSVEEAMNLLPDNDESFVMGGASIYKQMLPFATKLYLTLIHRKFEADTFFPEIDYSQWTETERTDITDDLKTDFSYTYLVLEKKQG
ncbi:MAG: dihydrofolate reductase [Salinivirgaceae bacterium]|nr:dihydrofolate reductase [Salinivirgaceae bacterium]